MTAYTPPDSLVAAVLSDLVYHSGNESIAPPPGWEKVDSYYDPNTGYYGEAWGKFTLDASGNPIPGSYSEIIQVNRGTVFTDSGPGSPTNVAASTDSAGNLVPGANLGTTAAFDNGATISADGQIALLGEKPAYLASADTFYSQIRNLTVNGTQPFLNIPIIEAGQSLGGATSDSVVADNYAPGTNLSAVTFNALPYGQGIAGLTSAEAGTLPITNYYVGNEQATQAYLVQGFLLLTGGVPIGNSVDLPDLPVLSNDTILDELLGRVTEIHDAAAGISQLYTALYTDPTSGLYTNPTAQDASSALAWLSARYPIQQYTPAQIQAVLNGTSVPTDQDLQQILFNINDTTSLVTDDNGNLAGAQQIETVSLSQAAAQDTYQVVSVVPNAANGEQAVWETDAYNTSAQLVGITQSKVYTDGSFAVYTYSPTRVLQSIYSADATGDQLVQTYSAAGELQTSVNLSPSNTIEVKQYSNDPTLISDSTIDLGAALVTSIVEESDQSVLAVLGYGVTSATNGTYAGLLAKPDGTLDAGLDTSGTFQPVVDFAVDGLSGGTEDVSVTNGNTVLDTQIAQGGTVEVGSSFVVGSTQTNFTFSGVVGSPVGAPTGLLKLDDPWSFNGTIYDAVTGDFIDLVGVKSIQIEQFAGTNDPVFILKNPTTGQIATIRFDPAESYVNSLFGIGNLLGNGDFVLEVNRSSICYLAGTHILTPTGEALVEDLKIGDLVVTRFSGMQPIKWIGRQSYDSRFIRNNCDHIPVCVHAGALADHMPARDLYVSPGHSMLVDGQLVLARSLVNGITITQDNCPDEIQYFQIELASHDCVIAEGAWSETFADGPGLREQFHNVAEFAELYPDHPPATELSLCAPRPEHGAKLDALLRPVVARTAATLTPGPLRGYIDHIEAPWAIVGWAQDTDHPELPVLLEVLLGDRVIATTLACDHRQDLQDAGIGQGRSAFCLTSPVRLRPEMLPTLRVRRVSDHAEIQMTPECRAKIDAMQQTQEAPGLRRVA